MSASGHLDNRPPAGQEKTVSEKLAVFFRNFCLVLQDGPVFGRGGVEVGQRQQGGAVGPAQPPQPGGHQPGEGRCAGGPQVGVVLEAVGPGGVDAGGQHHVKGAAARVAQGFDQAAAGVGQVDAGRAGAAGGPAAGLGVGAVAVLQPAVWVKAPPGQRGDEDRQRPGGLRLAGVGGKVLGVLRGVGVAAGAVGLFVVVAELDQQQVAGAQPGGGPAGLLYTRAWRGATPCPQPPDVVDCI